MNSSRWRAAIAEGGRNKSKRRADQPEADVGPISEVSRRFAKSVRGAEIHAMIFHASRRSPLKIMKRGCVPVAQQDRAQVS